MFNAPKPNISAVSQFPPQDHWKAYMLFMPKVQSLIPNLFKVLWARKTVIMKNQKTQWVLSLCAKTLFVSHGRWKRGQSGTKGRFTPWHCYSHNTVDKLILWVLWASQASSTKNNWHKMPRKKIAWLLFSPGSSQNENRSQTISWSSLSVVYFYTEKRPISISVINPCMNQWKYICLVLRLASM